MKTYTFTEPWLDTRCKLGEAPHWDREQNTLRFVDILAKEVHTVNLTAGPTSHRVHSLDVAIACTAEIEGRSDSFIFGGKQGYGIFTKETGRYEWIKKFDWAGVANEHEMPHRQRSNDGVVDARGRFLVGTMDDGEVISEPQPEGKPSLTYSSSSNPRISMYQNTQTDKPIFRPDIFSFRHDTISHLRPSHDPQRRLLQLRQ